MTDTNEHPLCGGKRRPERAHPFHPADLSESGVMTYQHSSARVELGARLRATLPSCHLEQAALPLCPGIELALLQSDLPQGPLAQDEMLAVLNQPAYWAFCWASGQVLARLLLTKPELARERVIIDFGAGSGVVGIAAKIAGASRVICCDLDDDARLACQVNAEINGVELEIYEDLRDIDGVADLLVAADVLYDRDNLPLLDLLPNHATHVLLADSRIKNFAHPDYALIGHETATTWPDLDEQKTFNEVKIYQSLLSGLVSS